MTLLVASIVTLAAGPLLYALGRRSGLTLALLDGFTFTAIFGMVALLLVPEAVAARGWVAAVLAAVGFFGPTLLEKLMHHAAAVRAHTAALWLALFGLALHAFFDGVALRINPGQGQSQMLALSVVLHRLPVALTIWWLIRPRYGRPMAVTALMVIAAATLGGFGFGSESTLGGTRSLILALVAGSLLHVLVHRPHGPDATSFRRRPLFEGLGGLLGIGLVLLLLLLFEGHEHHHEAHHHLVASGSIVAAFLALAAESAPALLLAYIGAGLLHAFLPRASISWLGRGGGFSQSLRGVMFGLPLPICSCGVVPLYRGLVLRGAPAAAALAFLVATPEIGIDAVLLSVPLLGADLTIARIVAAATVALLAGWLVSRVARPPEVSRPGDDAPHGAVGERLVAGMRVGLGELVDSTAPWILLGLALAAVATPLLDARWLAALPGGVDVVLFALIGMPTYVCASGATPLVSALVAKGMSPGAAIAFLLTGPATNVTTFGVLSGLHGKRLAAIFGVTVAGAAIVLGYLANAAIPSAQVFTADAHGHEMSLLQQAALAALVALVMLSLLRQGPRGFTGQVLLQATSQDRCDNSCGGDCGYVQEPDDGCSDSCCGTSASDSNNSCCTPSTSSDDGGGCCSGEEKHGH